MNNQNRDYNTITALEKLEWEALQEKEIVYHNGQPTKIRKSQYRHYPKAVRHYISLFPNNFIDAVDLIAEKALLITIIDKFQILLDNVNTTEREILNFIRNNNAYFLIGAILKSSYRFGHHALHIIPEFPLTISHKPDFVIIGQNSAGYHFVFVELENPYNHITTKAGSHGTTIRKGIKQIDDWEIWMEKYYSHLKPVFENKKNATMHLPNEFFEFDKTRMHYVVIAGRRDDFNEHTRRLNRTMLEQRKLLIIHYDNIIEEARDIIGQSTF